MTAPPTAILDVDGVLLASPHEQAWREALPPFASPARFTSAFYQAEVAGKPRREGALAALVGLGVADPQTHVQAYAAAKQTRLEALIAAGRVRAFPDAVRFVDALKARGIRMAAASSSRNASAMMAAIPLGDGGALGDRFDIDVSGRDVAHGKPAPDLFLLAAHALGANPSACIVVEDSPAGVIAAKAGGMRALGVARRQDAALLREAGADLVVASLDAVDLAALGDGRLRAAGV